jgi:hypothetical protein
MTMPESRAIFISYRRNDTEGEAGRLFDDLVEEFGDSSVFMDVAAIEAGRDFRKVIDESVAGCGVLLAIVGKSWVDAVDENGHRRLDNPTDFVRLETGSALRRDIPVIPILVRGAKMPRPEDLPDDLRDFAYRNSVELTHARWNSDLHLLVDALRRQLKIQKSGPLAPLTDGGEAGTATRRSAIEEQQPTITAAGNPDGQEKKQWPLLVGIAACVIAAAAGGYLFYNRQVTVPDVRGDAIAVASTKLNQAHLRVGHTTQRQDTTVDPNVVLSQYPPSDEQVRRGTAVDMVISEGAALVEVPDLTGQPLESALHTLSDHQLSIGDLERQARTGVARDIVLQQFPKAGETVKLGGKIDLLVSDVAPAQTSTPDNGNAAKTADANWTAQRATERAAAKQAALKAATERAAAENASAKKTAAADTAEKTAADKTAADNAAAQKVAPKVTIQSASCKALAPGRYQLDMAGTANVSASDTYLFYTWASVGTSGTRWRPVCSGWSVPAASDDSLWEVSCIHHPADTSAMAWQTSRIITSQNHQPPTTAGTTIFKPGMQSPASLKFNVTCQ